MEVLVEPEWSKVIGDESPTRATNERTSSVGSGTPDCTIDFVFVDTRMKDVHNHQLVSPRNHHRMKINRFIPEAAKNLTETFELHNISVFPNTKHRRCLWHIIHKFSEKIRRVYRDPSTFKTDIDSIIHNTYDPAEFDRRWNEIMKKHNLDDNN
ncbi:hypothetical protein GIB67_005888 [Kingdonia uniflora]|uniref:Protein FAR1-RELATED SEQUENCE n=1 Tax=Kingdonia uniflora TaxID=39325 RepID=A0A7J7MBS2_9MAGN|nr:hypothetical protein GIB67_005888 [Kingdonia uniflora]